MKLAVKQSAKFVFVVLALGLVFGCDHNNTCICGRAMLSAPMSVTVDYAQSIDDMIVAGHYDMVSDKVTAEHFSVSGNGQQKIDLVVVEFKTFTYRYGDVLAKLDSRGLRPATLAELLAFGAKYPNEQRKYPIHAFGSIWGVSPGDKYKIGRAAFSAYLYERHDNGKRTLEIECVNDDGHPGGSRYLAVKK